MDPDLAALQGVWRQVAHEADGGVEPDMEGAAGSLTTFAGNTFTVRTPDGTLLLAGTFALEPTTAPKSVTWIDSMGPDAGKPLLASYVLDRDRFVFIAAKAGDPRPTVFRTRVGQTMRTFVRVRESAAASARRNDMTWADRRDAVGVVRPQHRWRRERRR